VGSVTAGGDHRAQAIIATVPPTATNSEITGRGVFPDGQVRVSSSALINFDVLGTGESDISSLVVMGDALYDSFYRTGESVTPGLVRVGGGWGTFRAVERSYSEGTFARTNVYGLRGDGVLFRWTISNGWRNRTSYPGFSAVKSMVLISKTRTYDTFLANTRGGALYTIHIPTTSPLEPVVKLVRRTTWHVFESMVAKKCGQYGTLLLGIDKDTKAGYLYAVGHANGLATVIQGRGKVPVTFADPVYLGLANRDDQLFGE
jgi:hypothetical protein